MFKLASEQKIRLEEIGREYDLKFIILHGSFAKGAPRRESDLDIAIVAGNPISRGEEIRIYEMLEEILGNSRQRELDIKLINSSSFFFLYHVLKNGILLFGDERKFSRFKLYVLRIYQEDLPVRRLRDILLQKRQTHLESLAHAR